MPANLTGIYYYVLLNLRLGNSRRKFCNLFGFCGPVGHKADGGLLVAARPP